MDIYVNGEKVTVTPGRGSKPGAQMSVSYEMLAELAGLKGCMPTITWRAPDKTMGHVAPGQRVRMVEGMKIDAGVTGCA